MTEILTKQTAKDKLRTLRVKENIISYVDKISDKELSFMPYLFQYLEAGPNFFSKMLMAAALDKYASENYQRYSYEHTTIMELKSLLYEPFIS